MTDNQPKEKTSIDLRDARQMLEVLAQEDDRDLGPEVRWLIRQEFARRYNVTLPVTEPATVETETK